MQEIIGLENVNESLSTHYLIYKITNNINGKHYIGQHKTNNVFDNYAGSGSLIIKAEEKYGLSAFTKEILFDFDNFNDMNDKEIELVQLSNCWPQDKMSYNLVLGGGSRAMNGIINPMYGDFEHTKGFRAENNRRKGKTLEEIWGKDKAKEIRLKTSKSTSGKNNGCYSKKWLHNPFTKDKVYVFEDEVEKYLDNGYVKGSGVPTSKGRRWINNGIKELHVSPDEVDEYITDGWTIGKMKTTKKMIDPTTGKYKYIKSQNIQTYLDLGYVLCINKRVERMKIPIEKRKEITRQKLSQSTKDRKWLYHPELGKQVYIKELEVDKYLKLGYVFGMKPKN